MRAGIAESYETKGRSGDVGSSACIGNLRLGSDETVLGLKSTTRLQWVQLIGGDGTLDNGNAYQ